MVGKRISELRRRRGFSQSELARKLHVSVKSVKQWEAEISNPSVDNLIALAKLFSVSSDYLIGIEKREYICLGELSLSDRKKLSAIVQAFWDACLDDEK